MAGSTTVALLRGINVGGHHKVPMKELCALLSGLGLRDVRTCLQSGNAVFDGEVTAHRLEEALEARFGFRPAVVLRTAGEWRAAMAANPFAEQQASAPGQLLVVFLSERPEPPGVERLLGRPGPERVVVTGREAHVWYAEGIGRSKLSLDVIERHLGVAGTARNWNTVRKVEALLD